MHSHELINFQSAFTVFDDGMKISIHDRYNYLKSYEFEYDKIFKDEHSESGSILLKSEDKYIFIDNDIIHFQTTHEIIKFRESTNDYRCHYAYDNIGNAYLFNENVIIEQNKLLQDNMDPSEYYYKHYLITIDNGAIPPNYPVIKNFRGIEKFCINNTIYTLTYGSTPEKEYRRLKKMGKISFKYTDGTIEYPTLDQYVELMNEFGSIMGFKKMSDHICSFSQI